MVDRRTHQTGSLQAWGSRAIRRQTSIERGVAGLQHLAACQFDAALVAEHRRVEVTARGGNITETLKQHQGAQGLDAATYFKGHGLENVRCLRGGIDAWATEVDAKIRRYSFKI